MERIRLTKREKAVMRILSEQGYEALSEFDASAVRSLSELGFVMAAFTDGGGVEDAKLTTMGKEYLREFPRLYNPIRWDIISSVASIIAAIASTIALFIACTLLR